MIWGSTRELGCGTSSGTEIVILVCRYSPPGNINCCPPQTPFSQGAAQAVGEPETTLGGPPPQEGVGDGGGGDTSGDGGGGDTSGDGGAAEILAETVAAEILAETVAEPKIKEGQKSLLFLF